MSHLRGGAAKLLKFLEWFSGFIGRSFSWLLLVLLIFAFANVILRYVFGVVYIASFQAVNWCFGMVLTACAGYALLNDDHVRVDVLYRRASIRTKLWTDLLGSVFLLAPFLYVLWDRSFPYVRRSWILKEGPQELSGIPAVYLLKTFMLVFIIVLAVQGLAVLIKCILQLSAAAPLTTSSENQHHE